MRPIVTLYHSSGVAHAGGVIVCSISAHDTCGVESDSGVMRSISTYCASGVKQTIGCTTHVYNAVGVNGGTNVKSIATGIVYTADVICTTSVDSIVGVISTTDVNNAYDIDSTYGDVCISSVQCASNANGSTHCAEHN
ncbi:hypothetical protein MTO96_026417 [Rhipicephalus appendiculatus]